MLCHLGSFVHHRGCQHGVRDRHVAIWHSGDRRSEVYHLAGAWDARSARVLATQWASRAGWVPLFRGGGVCRHTMYFSRTGRTYSYGATNVPSQGWPPDIAALAEQATQLLRLPPEACPTACNLNLYEGGGHAVGWHQDDEPLWGRGPTLIISMSFLEGGGARRFQLARDRYGNTGRRTVWLGSGDLLTMSGACQQEFFHRAPPDNDAPGRRVNLTFRYEVMPAPLVEPSLQSDPQQAGSQNGTATAPAPRRSAPSARQHRIPFTPGAADSASAAINPQPPEPAHPAAPPPAPYVAPHAHCGMVRQEQLPGEGQAAERRWPKRHRQGVDGAHQRQALRPRRASKAPEACASAEEGESAGHPPVPHLGQSLAAVRWCRRHTQRFCVATPANSVPAGPRHSRCAHPICPAPAEPVSVAGSRVRTCDATQSDPPSPCAVLKYPDEWHCP